MRIGRQTLLLLGTVLLWTRTPCSGGEDGEIVTLRSLVAAARGENPEIRAAEARVRAMRERPVQEGTLPDPTVGVKYHNEQSDKITLGESEFSYVEFAAEQEVPFPGKLGLRASMATREAARETAMRDATVLMVLAKVASGYFSLAVIDRSIEILGESVRLIDLMIDQAHESYRVGTAAQQDVLRATLERGALSERLTRLEQKRAAAEAALNALLNRPASEQLPGVDWIDRPVAVDPLPELVGRLATAAPELHAARETVLRSEEALRLARREYYPDFALMGGYMNKNGLFPEWEIGLRVRLPLYFWRRQGPAVAEASHAKAAAEHEERNARVSLEGRLRELQSMAESASRLVRLYDGTLVPQAALTFESARASYAVGKVDFLTTLNAFTALLEYRMGHAEQMGDLCRARAEIGPLVGESPLDWWERVQ